MTEKASRGEAVTIPSYGYQIKEGKYIPDPDTAPIIRRIFTDFVNGKGMVVIARELNDMGLRTRRGNLFENRTIRYILRNPVYIGKIRWTPTGKANYRVENDDTLIIDGTHEPIIDMKLWNQAQEKIKALSRTKYMRQSAPKEPFMVEVVFQLDEAMWEKKTGAVLFDNKYVSWPSAKQKEYHNGFNLTVGKRSKRGGVTMLTRRSVHWAERITATSNWKLDV